MSLDTKKVKQFAELARKKDELNAALKRVNSEMAALKPVILDMFMDANVQNMPIRFRGGETRTVHVAKIINAKLKDREGCSRDEIKAETARALKKARVGWLVKEQFNMNSLSSWVRERLAEGKQLPKTLDPFIEIDEVTDLRVMKTSKTETASERASKTLAKGRKTGNA